MILLLDLLMPSKLVIQANRAGTIPEVCHFLVDLETAYNAIYQFETGLARESVFLASALPA